MRQTWRIVIMAKINAAKAGENNLKAKNNGVSENNG